jgi:hypothetical protein
MCAKEAMEESCVIVHRRVVSYVEPFKAALQKLSRITVYRLI